MRTALIILALCMPLNAYALTYQFEEQIFTIEPQKHWQRMQDTYTVADTSVMPLRGLSPQITHTKEIIWDTTAIAQTLESVIGTTFNREAGTVRISRENSNIVFDGLGLPGRMLDTILAAKLTIKALKEGITTIQLPVLEKSPRVIVEDRELRNLGVHELVTVGESDFSRSPANRRHNIALGLSQFNGHLISQGEEFSFNTVLGPVTPSAGFLKELTILGDRTLPAYGGGLCQVSTTVYRGAWKEGLPISARRNHSYAVRYYAPSGTDATIFPPWTDLRFVNDTPGALVMQTRVAGDNAYVLYYGSKPNRSTELIGPFTWDVKRPPSNRILTTDEIPPGETRIVSQAVPGMKTMWYRLLTKNGETTSEAFLSEYEARPYTEEHGIEPEFARLTDAPQDLRGNVR